MLASWKEGYAKPGQHITKQRHHFADKGPYRQSYGISSSHVQMWELDHKDGWSQKNWCFWTMMLENTLESQLDCKEIKPVNPKGNEPWIFTGGTDAEVLWSPDAKSWLIWKRPWFWERLKVGGEGDDRGWDGWMNLGKLWEMVGHREAWYAAGHGVMKSRTQLGDWTTQYKTCCVAPH